MPENLQISIDQALGMPEDVVIMCTGSQGEPTSIMGRLSTGHQPFVRYQTWRYGCAFFAPDPGE
jgi:mRNA degradation ribonuclease J1/J2